MFPAENIDQHAALSAADRKLVELAEKDALSAHSLTRLVRAGGNANLRIFGQPLLNFVIDQGGPFELIQQLVKEGADVNAVDPCGVTALLSAPLDDDRLAAFLLECGADPHHADASGECFLDRMAQLQPETARRLEAIVGALDETS